jgi:predicted methyltransferase
MGAGFVAVLALASPGAGRAAPAYIGAAVDNPARPAADKARDDARKPAEMLEFARVRPGQTVVDFLPGSGYFTRLFSTAVGPKGHVYAFVPTEVASHVKVMPANGATDPAMPNVTYLVGPVMSFSTPTPVDMVWTSQNYHDLHDPFMGPADMAKFNAAVFASLKPGGLFVVEDHAAAAGSGVSATNTLHRIDPAVVKREVMGAGFVFDGESKVLRNPADTHTLLVFDKTIRGHTDQFAYRFKKP